jgi:peptidyl-prolyl cis-trans isomerase D
MMEMFRNAAQSWVAKLLLGLLALSFVAWGTSDYTVGSLLTKDIATVGSRSIAAQDYSRELQNTLQAQTRQLGKSVTIEDARRSGLDRQILENMIARTALAEKADKLGVKVGDKQVAQDVANDPRFQDSTGKFDADRFRNLLTTNGLTEPGFLASEKSRVVNQAIMGAVQIAAPPKTFLEAQNQFSNELRDVKYFTFKVGEADVAAPTDDDLKKQYEGTPAAYTAPELRSIAVLSLAPRDVTSKVTVSEEDIAATFDKYGANYIVPEKRTVLQLSFANLDAAKAAKAKLDGGMDFIALATEMKFKETDITFAEQAKTDFLDAKIGEAAFTTAEGQVSAPVAGSLNTVLLKVAKVMPGKTPTLADLRNEMTERAKLDRASEEIQAVYDSVEDALAQQTKLEDIASKGGMRFQLIPAVSAVGTDIDGKPVAVPAGADLLRAAYESDVGVDNQPLNFEDGYVWFDVREVTPSALRPLDKVKDAVTKDWKSTKLRGLAADKAKAMVEKAKSGVTLDVLATENKSTVQAVTGLKRNQQQETFDGVATLAAFAVGEGSFTWALEGDGTSARVMQVTKVTVPPLNLATTEIAAAKEQITASLNGDMQEVFTAANRQSLGAVVDEKIWQQISAVPAQ